MTWLLNNREIIIFSLTVISGFIPTALEIKTNKKSLNFKGWLFVLAMSLLTAFTVYCYVYDKRKIKQSDISLVFELKTYKFIVDNIDYPKLVKELPENIVIPSIKFGKANTSGNFKLQSFHHGNAHSYSTTYITYKCEDILIKDISDFPSSFDDLSGIRISFNLPVQNLKQKDFQLPTYVILKIRDNEYSTFLEDDGFVQFQIPK